MGGTGRHLGNVVFLVVRLEAKKMMHAESGRMQQ